MARKKKEPDKLSREVAQALACGMSYGKWKAMQDSVKIEKKEIPDGYKKCKGCGELFIAKDVRQLYCDGVCRHEANYRRNREKINERARNRARERREKEGADND